MQHKYILLAIFFLLVTYNCYATVTGTPSHGETVVITGSGFGSKTTAEPLMFDDFETGSADLSWTYAYDQDDVMEITTSGVRGVSTQNAVFNMYESKSGGFSWIDGVPVKSEIYVYYWAKKKWVWGEGGETDYSLFAWNRVGGHDEASANPNVYGAKNAIGGFFVAEEFLNVNGDLTEGSTSIADLWSDNDWVLIESYYKISQGTEDGSCDLYFNGILESLVRSADMSCSGMDGVDAHAAGVYNKRYGWGGYQPTDRFYQDDVYVDDTPARVMLCTNADGTGVREIQVASAWADGEITITFNQGGFPNGGKAYLCVWDSTNTLKSSDEVTIGSSCGSNGTTSQGIRVRSQFTNNGSILVH